MCPLVFVARTCALYPAFARVAGSWGHQIPEFARRDQEAYPSSEAESFKGKFLAERIPRDLFLDLKVNSCLKYGVARKAKNRAQKSSEKTNYFHRFFRRNSQLIFCACFSRRMPPCVAKTCVVQPVFARGAGEPWAADPSKFNKTKNKIEWPIIQGFPRTPQSTCCKWHFRLQRLWT